MVKNAGSDSKQVLKVTAFILSHYLIFFTSATNQ